jgi:hypothetical protein
MLEDLLSLRVDHPNIYYRAQITMEQSEKKGRILGETSFFVCEIGSVKGSSGNGRGLEK